MTLRINNFEIKNKIKFINKKMAEATSDNFISVEKMSIDQLAGAFVMIAGAIGSLLLVIWQSKCHCKMNLCYIFSCERRPPNEDEMKSLKDQAKKLQDKRDKKKDDEEQNDEKLIPQKSNEPEPEPEILNLT
tara:strand:- start:1098 stop:1493 length:396 start_codon:yes stop_codon:yes gene_type:complete